MGKRTLPPRDLLPPGEEKPAKVPIFAPYWAQQ